jgi:uncharacterized membrane protein
MMSPDLIAGIIAFLVTLMILSYLIGDNPLFRVTVYIFVGVSAGYVAAVSIRQVLVPDLLQPLYFGFLSHDVQRAILAVPLPLSGLLLMKAWPPLTRLGMPAMGFLVGTAAAVAVGGAVNGTIIPQTNATIAAFDAQKFSTPEPLINAMFILAGLVTTLVYFHFGARARADGSVRRFGFIEFIAFLGSIFLAITLGVLFAGVYSAALTALIDRLHFFGTFFGFG